MANTFSAYYSSLYNLSSDPSTPQPNSQAIDAFLNSINHPSLSPTQQVQLSSPFTAAEIVDAIKSLPLHKSLGADGYSNEYFKHIPDLLAPRLATLFNFALSSGSFLPERIITTIPKLDIDPQSPSSY